MGIAYNSKARSFKLDAKNTSYIIAIVDEEQFLGHVYFGERLLGEGKAYKQENRKLRQAVCFFK